MYFFFFFTFTIIPNIFIMYYILNFYILIYVSVYLNLICIIDACMIKKHMAYINIEKIIFKIVGKNKNLFATEYK